MDFKINCFPFFFRVFHHEREKFGKIALGHDNLDPPRRSIFFDKNCAKRKLFIRRLFFRVMKISTHVCILSLRQKVKQLKLHHQREITFYDNLVTEKNHESWDRTCSTKADSSQKRMFYNKD